MNRPIYLSLLSVLSADNILMGVIFLIHGISRRMIIIKFHLAFHCEVLPTSAEWFGVTYPGDKPMVMQRLKDLVDKKQYPSPLW